MIIFIAFPLLLSSVARFRYFRKKFKSLLFYSSLHSKKSTPGVLQKIRIQCGTQHVYEIFTSKGKFAKGLEGMKAQAETHLFLLLSTV